VAAKRPEKQSKTHAANGLLDPPCNIVRNAHQAKGTAQGFWPESAVRDPQGSPDWLEERTIAGATDRPQSTQSPYGTRRLMKTPSLPAAFAALLAAIGMPAAALSQQTTAPQQKAQPPASQKQTAAPPAETLPPPKPDAPAGAKTPRRETPATPEPRPLRRLFQQPADSPERAQRRERLREFGGQLLDTLAGGAQPAAQGGTAGGLDVGRVNGGLTALIKALVVGDARIESIELELDPAATDFNKDMLKLRGNVALRASAWSDQPSTMALALAARVEPGTLAQGSVVPTRALLDGHVTAHTQTLALVNYALVQYKQKLADDQKSAANAPASEKIDPDDPDQKMQQRLNEKLARIGQLRSLDELADLLLYMSGLQLTAINERIERLQAEVDGAPGPAPDGKTRDELAAKLVEARRDRDRMLDVKPRIQRSADGRATNVTLIMERSEPLTGVQVERVQVGVTDQVIDISALASLSRGLELYPLIKPVVLATLQRLSTGDGRAIEAVRIIVAEPFARARQIIVGDQPPAKEF
jgi:hypothetical protein